jgi:hypothetical protein
MGYGTGGTGMYIMTVPRMTAEGFSLMAWESQLGQPTQRHAMQCSFK